MRTALPGTGAARARLLIAAAVLAIAGSVSSLPHVTAAAPAYTALGDSYSSGVGTRTYFSDGTSCQRSPDAYPVLDAARLGATLTFAACSGARVADVQGGQLGSLNAATAFVTVGVGGDDAGFSSVIEQCALPAPFTCTSQIAAANAFITGTLPGRLDGLYSQIRTLAPHARVVVVGYPRLFNGQQCNPLARISPAEQASLNQSADLLDDTTRARATAHGFGFADARPAFTGHAVCDAVEWINGLSNPPSESYHPNVQGQAGYADLVEPVLRS